MVYRRGLQRPTDLAVDISLMRCPTRLRMMIDDVRAVAHLEVVVEDALHLRDHLRLRLHRVRIRNHQLRFDTVDMGACVLHDSVTALFAGAERGW